MIGSEIGHFTVIEKLGEGAMGEVFRAEDTKLDRTVALKFLSLDLFDDPVSSERFLREARAIAALNHPHICTIFETGEYEGRPFFAMEHLEGNTLEEAIAEGPLAITILQSVALQLADALYAAHSKGILHRDLKPANVFLDEQGNIKLLDFGLAKTLNSSLDDATGTLVLGSPSPDSEEMARLVATVQGSLTQVGSTLGTLAYMSPEQLRGEELDQRSDLFSFGLVLYEMATGKKAFGATSIAPLFDAILNRMPEPAGSVRPEVPESLDTVIQRLMQKNRDERFESAGEIRDALMLSSSSPRTVRTQSSSSASLSTLGKKRSPAWVVVLAVGAVLLGGTTGRIARRAADSGMGWQWQDGLVPGIIGLLLLVLAVLIRWRSGRGLRKQMTGRSVKLTRLQEQPSNRGWLLTTVGIGAIAAANTVVLVHSAWARWMQNDSSESTASLIGIGFGTGLLWFCFLNARKWRDHPPSRRWQEIEVHGSYAQVLASISEVITELEARVTGMDLEKGFIRASTSVSMYSWGENVSFAIEESGAGVFTVRIASESSYTFAVFSMKNRANLRLAVDRLAG